MPNQPDHDAEGRDLLDRVSKLLRALKYEEALPLARRARRCGNCGMRRAWSVTVWTISRLLSSGPLLEGRGRCSPRSS
jgi:hypothetical protein